MKQLALACHNYVDVNQVFPPGDLDLTFDGQNPSTAYQNPPLLPFGNAPGVPPCSINKGVTGTFPRSSSTSTHLARR